MSRNTHSTAMKILVGGCLVVVGVVTLAQPSDTSPSIRPNRDELCTQPLDPTADKVPSENNEVDGIICEVASDCWTDGPGTLTRVVWWGGYIAGEPGDPPVTTFNVRFYDDNECLPGVLLAELLDQSPTITYVVDDPHGYPTYVYELDTDVELLGGPFWFSVQGNIDHYPPLHGRAGDGGDIGGSCETAFRGEYYGFPDWVPVRDLLGEDWVASQQFEFTPVSTPVDQPSWGATKSLYR